MAHTGAFERAVMRAVLAAMAVTLASPVAAQDVAIDYAAAYARIYSDQQPTALVGALNGLQVLPQIEGDWILAAILMNGPDYDPRMADVGCERLTLRIEREGEFGFTTRTIRSGDPQTDVRTYMFSRGNFFAFTTDLDGLATRLFATEDFGSISSDQLAAGVFTSANAGFVRVELIGEHGLVMESPTAPSMVLIRCP